MDRRVKAKVCRRLVVSPVVAPLLVLLILLACAGWVLGWQKKIDHVGKPLVSAVGSLIDWADAP